jgi:hypothetical protein
MFGVQLTITQKLEAALICVILGVAGVFIFRSVQPTFDTAINAFTFPRVHPVNDPTGKLPVTTTNPRDPKKDETVTMISVADGKMEIVKYPNNTAKRLTLKWRPETRYTDLKPQYHQDPLAPVDRIKDKFLHALAYATYNQVYVRSLSLLRYANMTGDQIPKEAEARDRMNKEIKMIDAGMDAGTFRPELLDDVAKAMDAYNAKPGAPTENKAKADLARKLLDAANAYFNAILAEKDKSIDTYMAVIDKLLTADQKLKFIEGYQNYIQSTRPSGGGVRGRTNIVTTPSPARSPARGAAPARGATPARGGTPARGTAAVPARSGTATTTGPGAR